MGDRNEAGAATAENNDKQEQKQELRPNIKTFTGTNTGNFKG